MDSASRVRPVERRLEATLKIGQTGMKMLVKMQQETREFKQDVREFKREVLEFKQETQRSISALIDAQVRTGETVRALAEAQDRTESTLNRFIESLAAQTAAGTDFDCPILNT